MEDELITLISSDGVSMQTDFKLTELSGTLKTMLEDGGYGDIPLSTVDSDTLRKVLEWSNYYMGLSEGESEDQEWVSQFFQVNDTLLFSVILAANYLHITPLLDLCCKHVANEIKDLSPEDIRQKYSVENDFEPGEEESLTEEYKWCSEQ